MTAYSIFSALSAACCALLLAVGCQSSVDRQVALTVLGNTCRINSDCDALLVCAFKICHQECVTSRDCGGNAHCVAGDQPRHVCLLPTERSCSGSVTCPGIEVCGSDAQCRDACASNRDCLGGQACAGGTCADPGELDDAGALTDAGGSALPLPCAYNSDCSGDLVCLAGVCRAECTADTDCASGKNCQKSRCLPAFAADAGCLRNSDCAADQACVAGACTPLPETGACSYDSACTKPGQHCLAGACTCECALDANCAAGYACQGGCACVPNRVIDGDVTILDERQLSQLSNVVEVMGALRFGSANAGDTALPASLAVPFLKRVGSLELRGSASLVSLAFPRLEHAGALTLTNAPALETLALPALATVANVSITQTGLKSLAAFDPMLGAVLQTAGNLTFKSNPALPVCAAEALSKDLSAWLGTLTNIGNLGCSCPGLACCKGPVCQ